VCGAPVTRVNRIRALHPGCARRVSAGEHDRLRPPGTERSSRLPRSCDLVAGARESSVAPSPRNRIYIHGDTGRFQAEPLDEPHRGDPVVATSWWLKLRSLIPALRGGVLAVRPWIRPAWGDTTATVSDSLAPGGGSPPGRTSYTVFDVGGRVLLVFW